MMNLQLPLLLPRCECLTNVALHFNKNRFNTLPRTRTSKTDEMLSWDWGTPGAIRKTAAHTEKTMQGALSWPHVVHCLGPCVILPSLLLFPFFRAPLTDSHLYCIPLLLSSQMLQNSFFIKEPLLRLQLGRNKSMICGHSWPY